MNKDQAIHRITQTRQSLLQALAHLGETEMNSRVVEGVWTVKDVLGHLAAWERVCLEPLERFATGRPFESESIPDHDAWNAIQAARRRALPVSAILTELQQVRGDLMGAAARLGDDQWRQPLDLPWGERATLAHMLSGLAWHEEEHMQAILRGKNT
jgi:uncharacterized damage-inducible protein DinB